MNKYFTKEYIKESKADEIQKIRRQIRYEEGLSYQQFYKGDYRYYEDAPKKDNIVLVTKDELWQVNVHFWLPTGDQLDEEIVKICKERELEYIFMYEESWGYCVETHDLSTSDETINEVKINEDNPLIAKIKLLKELLKQ